MKTIMPFAFRWFVDAYYNGSRYYDVEHDPYPYSKDFRTTVWKDERKRSEAVWKRAKEEMTEDEYEELKHLVALMHNTIPVEE